MCAIERSYPNVGVDQISKLYLEYFSSYVRTDPDLYTWSNTETGVYAIERSYHKVGVGQI